MKRPGRQHGWSGSLVWPMSGAAGLGSNRAAVCMGAGRHGHLGKAVLRQLSGTVGPASCAPESLGGWHECVIATTGACRLTLEEDWGVQGDLEEEDLRSESPSLSSAAEAGHALGAGPWPRGPGCLLGGPTQSTVWNGAHEPLLQAEGLSGVKAARGSQDWWDGPRTWSIRGC